MEVLIGLFVLLIGTGLIIAALEWQARRESGRSILSSCHLVINESEEKQ